MRHARAKQYPIFRNLPQERPAKDGYTPEFYAAVDLLRAAGHTVYRAGSRICLIDNERWPWEHVPAFVERNRKRLERDAADRKELSARFSKIFRVNGGATYSERDKLRKAKARERAAKPPARLPGERPLFPDAEDREPSVPLERAEDKLPTDVKQRAEPKQITEKGDHADGFQSTSDIERAEIRMTTISDSVSGVAS